MNERATPNIKHSNRFDPGACGRPAEMPERRSTRKRERTFTVPENIAEGLREFVGLNKKEVAEMLDEDSTTSESALVEHLIAIMGQQALTSSTLLGRFFSAESLGKYCELKGKSPKGGCATLASRVAGIWEKSASKKSASAVKSTESSTSASDSASKHPES